MKQAFSLYIFLLSAGTCFSQTWQDTIVLIESAMSRYQPINPGCQLSIKRKEEVIYSKAFGMADLEHNVPLTLHSIIEAGSVSKQFTAAAILLLEQQGKLSLNDDVRKYIPELPDYGTVIKLEQMMHHTSGLRDWGAVAALSGWARGTKTYNNDDALEIIAAQKELNNIPGAEFIYSNSNYNLLAMVVQRVSGQSLAAFTKENIFLPAGMTHTEWRDNHKRIVKDRAIAYALTGKGYQIEMPNEDVYGNGGLLTTTEDLLKWNDFYHLGKLGTASLFLAQTKTAAFNNGSMNDYGAGLFIQNFRGWNNITHGGATAGYRASLEMFPELNLSIAFLSNTAQFDTAIINLNGTLRNIFIKEQESQQAINKTETNMGMPESRLIAHAGWYKNDRDGSGVKMEVRDKKLFMNNALLIQQSENKFKISTTERLIVMDESGGLQSIVPDRDTIHYSKADTSLLTTDHLINYEGKYFSTETNSSIKVYQHDGKLMIHLKLNTAYQLKPTYKDAFTITDIGGNLYFIKNRKSKIVAMKVSIPRARNISFEKLK